MQQPLWLQPWLGWMGLINMTSVAFLKQREARWVLGAFTACASSKLHPGGSGPSESLLRGSGIPKSAPMASLIATKMGTKVFAGGRDA